jgi:cytoskeleton protein RodZ
VITRGAEPAPAFEEPVTRSPAPVETRLPAPASAQTSAPAPTSQQALTSTLTASPEAQRASVPAVSPGGVTADDTDPETELETATGRAPAAEDYSGPELEIVFVADSWTEIIAESGERLFYNLGRAGTTATVPADRNMNLMFGNAAGVELRLDGEPYAIPATARRRGNTAQWDLAARVAEPETDD